MSRVRADQRLVDLGLAPSRARARALILDGKVAGISKPGQMIAAGATPELLEPDHPWVSRGGLKLVQALDHFGLPVQGRTCLDVGASTGGFTDVLLSRGAVRVFAVDVGHGQLHPRLAADDRVVSMEGVNSRDLDAAAIPEPIDACVADVSFISLAAALPAALALCRPGAWLLALVKPQFEVGREHVGKGGIVRDEAVRDQVPDRIGGWLEAAGWRTLGVIASPIQGSDGNREFLIGAEKTGDEGQG